MSMSNIHESTPIQDIEEQLAFHTKESTRLKNLLNARAPINRLPPEILSLIFVFQAEIFHDLRLRGPSPLWYHNGTDEAAHSPIYTWLNVTSVCKHWREVALQCASFWTYLVIDQRIPEESLSTFIARSKGLPLTVVAHAFDLENHCPNCIAPSRLADSFCTGFDELERVFPRVAELTLYILEAEDEHEQIWCMISSSSNSLTSLRVEGVGDVADRCSTRQHMVECPVHVPDSWVMDPMPAPLLSLVFAGVRVAWDNNAFFCPTLRHLEITECYMLGKGVPEPPPDLGELLDALRGMPALESFRIDSLSFPAIAAAHPYDTVDLPRLRRLEVPLTHGLAPHLAAYLRLPHDASIHFTDQTNTAHWSSSAILTEYMYTRALPRLLENMHVYAISQHFGHIEL
ncbi:hypothetical protein C2E23DRAFT_335207 [Lenzites betulinus]|nr:hypothetical protein C2E23DRAFT_335207 [Lenzites betulinus]